VVEDNLTNQRIIAAILQSLDFDVRFAADGAKAVKAARIERLDIILMDIHMPVMDGFEATKEIRDLGGWCASVPIIAVTAKEMAKDRVTCVTAGFNDLVPKPIDTRQRAETISSPYGEISRLTARLFGDSHSNSSGKSIGKPIPAPVRPKHGPRRSASRRAF
jgi:CheY-like chemotaxis protein